MREKESNSGNILIKSALYVFAFIGFLCIVLIFLASKVLLPNMDRQVYVGENTLLSIDMNRKFPETTSEDLISEMLGDSSFSLYDLIATIKAAKEDDGISAIVAFVDNSSLGAAQIDEVRDAIKDFRKSGKKAYAYSQGFGFMSGGLSEYYLATAFDEIVMQPQAVLGITGVGIEVPFFHKLFKQIGINPEFYARHEYKNAIASLTDESMSAHYREQMKTLVDGFGSYILEKISKDRGVDYNTMKQIVNKAPIFAAEALENGLIDTTGYKEELISRIGAEQIISDEEYISTIGNYYEDNKIAVLFLNGVIESGDSQAEKLSSEAIIGEDTTLKILREIAEDESIKALVIRVNSPGGSYTATNEIWYALKTLKEKRQMPIVVSQGDYAASGGYFISLPADYIYTQPLTLTGSIGVFGGKIVVAELMDKLKINWDGVYFGDNAAMESPLRNFDAKQKEVFNKSLDLVYEDFVKKVMQDRNIKEENMDKIARGRVWIGLQAVENHLADEIGGLEEAVIKAAQLAGVEKYEKEVFPKNKSFQERLADFISEKTNISLAKIMPWAKVEVQNLNFIENMNKASVYMPIIIKM